MSREVDIKALVSHIVRGDGADKCRICLGDTTDGQVYLGDTVMMDGERPITLSELLETITGVKVLQEDDLPPGLCPICSDSVIAAGGFRNLCLRSQETWNSALDLIHHLPSTDDLNKKKSVYLILADQEITVIDNYIDDNDDNSCSSLRNCEEESLTKAVLGPKPRVFKENEEDIYQCPDCGKYFSRLGQLCEHLKESMDFKRACYICASIMTRDELVEHLKSVHRRNPFACDKCPALFQDRNRLRSHIDEAHSAGAYNCVDCGRTFKSSHSFYGHISVHSNRFCPVCDKQFRNNRCYLHHVRHCCKMDRKQSYAPKKPSRAIFEVINKKTEKKIKVGARGSSDTECICDYCGKTFAGKKFVCAHIQIVHMKNTHRPCPYCGKFLAKSHLPSHIKTHGRRPTFTCEHCNVLFKSKLGYIQHVRLHTGELPYLCKYCPESFSASSRRSEHVRKMHKTDEERILRNACEFCPARFRLPYRLKKHMLTVHGDKSSYRKEFECSQCHVMFASCRGLLHHSRQHQEFTFQSSKKARLSNANSKGEA